MRQGETFAATGLDSALFLVGRNSRGQWVAQDQRGARGGLFVSRSEAFKFARRENGNRPELVVEITFNDVQASPHYPGGFALRFARVKGYRPDKPVQEADTMETVRAIFAAQDR